jgi:hypothetical protein
MTHAAHIALFLPAVIGCVFRRNVTHVIVASKSVTFVDAAVSRFGNLRQSCSFMRYF